MLKSLLLLAFMTAPTTLAHYGEASGPDLSDHLDNVDHSGNIGPDATGSSVSASSAGGISVKPIHQHVSHSDGRSSSSPPPYDGNTQNIMLCEDGTFVEVNVTKGADWDEQPFQMENICSDHGGRKACPHSVPYHCNSFVCGVNATEMCCVEEPSDCGVCCGQYSDSAMCDNTIGLQGVTNGNETLCGIPVSVIKNSKTNYCMDNMLTAPYDLCNCFIVWQFEEQDCTVPCKTTAPTMAPTMAPTTAPLTMSPTMDGGVIPVNPGDCPDNFVQAKAPGDDKEFCLFTNESYCPAICSQDTKVPEYNARVDCDGGCGYVPDQSEQSTNILQIGGDKCPKQQPLCPVAVVDYEVVLKASTNQTDCVNLADNSTDGKFYYQDRLRRSSTRVPPCNATQKPCGYTACQYDCLRNHPGEQWFYVKVTTAGTMAFDTVSEFDHDFAVWGPYNTLEETVADCPNHPNWGARDFGIAEQWTIPPGASDGNRKRGVLFSAAWPNPNPKTDSNWLSIPLAPLKTRDCGYSPSPIENVTVELAQVGYYTFLFSNYAQADQILNMNLSPLNTAEYDCDFLKRCDGTAWNIVPTDITPDTRIATPRWFRAEYKNGKVEECPGTVWPNATVDYLES